MSGLGLNRSKMSQFLECLLDDERRAECGANDAAMAMGRPIVARRPTIQPVQRTTKPHPAQSESLKPAHLATDELRKPKEYIVHEAITTSA